MSVLQIRMGNVRQRLRRLALYGGMVTVSLVVAGIAAESFVRLLAPQQLIIIRPDLWEPSTLVGWNRRPNVHVRINTGERPVDIYTDSLGFRVGQAGRTEAATQILLIGDSFIEALQVQYEQTLGYLLEQRVSDQTRSVVAVRSAGVSGWGPNHYLARVRELLQQGEYALVVVAIYVGNDAITHRTDSIPPRPHAERKRFRVPHSLRWNELVNALLAPINDFFEIRSHLFVLVKNRLATIRMRMGLTGTNLPREYYRVEVNSTRWSTTGTVARDLALSARAAGTPTLFVLLPSTFQVHEQDFYNYLRGFDIDSSAVDIDQPTRLLGDALRQERLCVVDALPDFRTAAREGARLYGRIDSHLSPQGHALLAEVLAGPVTSLLAISSERLKGRYDGCWIANHAGATILGEAGAMAPPARGGSGLN